MQSIKILLKNVDLLYTSDINLGDIMNFFTSMVFFLFVAFTQTAFADNITLLSASTAGGGVDKTNDTIEIILKNNGNNVFRKNFKFCVDALNYLAASPKNTFFLTYTGDVYVDGKAGTLCPPVDPSMAVEVYSNVIDNTMTLTAVPGFSGTSIAALQEISKTHIIKIGTVHTVLAENKLAKFGKMAKIRYVYIPYSSQGELRTAIAAKDLDLVFATTVTNEILANGGSIVAVSSKKYSSATIPNMGDPDFTIGYTYLRVVQSTDPAVEVAMQAALSSPVLHKFASLTGGTVSNITTGVTATETSKYIISTRQQINP
jgi:tripartite-type tricarboxylate transporter receptor subunit TctC